MAGRGNEVDLMIYVTAGIVVAVIIIGAVLIRRKSNDRGVTYAPEVGSAPIQRFSSGAPAGPGVLPQVAIPTNEVRTEGIAHDEFVADVSDDLLDPNNPHHAEWVKSHPEMETDTEWVAEHPEDNPS
jgi:hypothetical protein